MSISPNIVKALTDLTGEPRLDLAIHEIIKDAVEHRMEKLQVKIKELEKKYQMSFIEFDQKFQAKEIPDQFGYMVESDYLEWEGLISRYKRLEEILRWVE